MSVTTAKLPRLRRARKPDGEVAAFSWRSKLVIYGGLAIFALISFFPFYWMFVVGSHTTEAVNSIPPVLTPGKELGHNLSGVFDRIDYWRVVANSLFVAGTITVSVVLQSTMAGFAFAKLNFRGRRVLFVLVIATMLIPPELGILPRYILMADLGWVDHLQAVIVPGLVSAFGVFWMKQYIETTVPDEVLDAARVDGCSAIRVWWSIVLPMCKPAAAALAILTFVLAWNDFLWPLVVLRSADVQTMQLALRTLHDAHFEDYALILSGTVIGTLPVLLVYVLLGRYLVSGIMEGAVKA